jgi:hypothetical protein
VFWSLDDQLPSPLGVWKSDGARWTFSLRPPPLLSGNSTVGSGRHGEPFAVKRMGHVSQSWTVHGGGSDSRFTQAPRQGTGGKFSVSGVLTQLLSESNEKSAVQPDRPGASCEQKTFRSCPSPWSRAQAGGTQDAKLTTVPCRRRLEVSVFLRCRVRERSSVATVSLV